MKYKEDFIIIDEPYGMKLYEVYIMPCKLRVSSCVLQRHVTTDEIQNDELLMRQINQYLDMTQLERNSK